MSAARAGVSAVAMSNELVTAPAIARAFIAVSPLTRRCGHRRHVAFELLENSHERMRMQTAGTHISVVLGRTCGQHAARRRGCLLQPVSAASVEDAQVPGQAKCS